MFVSKAAKIIRIITLKVWVRLHKISTTTVLQVCVLVCLVFSAWSPGWRGYGREWPEWFCPCTASDAGWSPPAPSERRPAERQRREKEKPRWNGKSHQRSAWHTRTGGRLTSSLEALSISAARHWALVWHEKRFLASYKLRLRISAFRSSFWSRSLKFSCVGGRTSKFSSLKGLDKRLA